MSENTGWVYDDAASADASGKLVSQNCRCRALGPWSRMEAKNVGNLGGVGCMFVGSELRKGKSGWRVCDKT
jgi:hypothetical protein